MSDIRFDVVGIGNAIVDILAQVEDAFLTREDIHKGTMTLVDFQRAQHLLDKIGTTTMVSGGSAANTVAGLASLGVRTAYLGKVHEDVLGKAFMHDMRALKVHYPTPPATEGAPTACCIILITPDGQRSMNTFLGASTDFAAADIDELTIRDSAVTYLEGYLFDKPPAMDAFMRASTTARHYGRKVAFSLSDPFCVDRHRKAFRTFVKHSVDIVFANELEACALYQKESLEEVLPLLGMECALAVVTRSERGSIILDRGEVITVAPEKVEKVVDTTGAGDLYAAGFLYGLARGESLQRCGRYASRCAAEIISHIGPRPQTDLKRLVEG